MEKVRDQGEGIGVGEDPGEDKERQKDQGHTAAWEGQAVRRPEGDPYQEHLQRRNING